ncbi:type 1 glutamine amidotransferase [Caldanaerobius polysaccharolyticus]|uniref:type 1 glutamine amidotransferase n=1 Tax=Caldanaerobius polysaccharolyticus TaxID=44256 RepID=UPI00047BB4E7|nr:glutamine amidotransferase [Caldanaerobius polysaccharolyticus]
MLKLCYLYPDLMNLYGDRGNVIAIEKRCQWRGIDVLVDKVGIGDNVDFNDYDIVFMGGGQDKEQNLMSEDLLNVKAPSLKDAAENGVVILAVCGSYQLLGNYYRAQNGTVIPGMGLLDVYTESGKDRLVGNVVVQLDSGEMIVGFENHSGRTYLGDKVKPLGKVLVGNGNNGIDGYEGAVYKNVFGTYIHGPLLPKNPVLTDMLISRALARHGINELIPLDDEVENMAHQKAIDFFYNNK